MDRVTHVRPLGRGFVLHDSNGLATFASRKNLYDWWRNGRCYYVELSTGKVFSNIPDKWVLGIHFRDVVNARELLELSRRNDLPARTRTKVAEG